MEGCGAIFFSAFYLVISDFKMVGDIPDNADIFRDLQSLESTLSPNNRKLVPVLKQLFSGFRSQLLTDLDSRYETLIASLKEDCSSKDAKITEVVNKNKLLMERIDTLEEKLDNEDAYVRRESLIFSGDAVYANHQEQDCTKIVQNLLREKMNVVIKKEDISVSHRLGPKLASQVQDKRNIVARFCRRDLKREVLLTCRSQKPQNIFVNESLTPLRRKISAALRQAKRVHRNIVSGMTTIDGRVFVWTKSAEGAGGRDFRHSLNTLPSLEVFCQKYFKRSASHYLPKPHGE